MHFAGMLNWMKMAEYHSKISCIWWTHESRNASMDEEATNGASDNQDEPQTSRPIPTDELVQKRRSQWPTYKQGDL